MICNNCTARIPDKSIICPACGAPTRNSRQAHRSAPDNMPQAKESSYAAPVNDVPVKAAPQQQYMRAPQQNPAPVINSGRYPVSPGQPMQPYPQYPQGQPMMPQEMPISAYGQQREYQQPMQNIEEERKPLYGAQPFEPYRPQNVPVQRAEAPVQRAEAPAVAPAAAQEPASTYKPPVFPELEEEEEAENVGDIPPCSTGAFFGTILMYAIPVIGFIFYIVWAFSKKTNPSRRNYCRAVLLMTLIGILLVSAALIVLYTVFHINYVEEIQSYIESLNL